MISTDEYSVSQVAPGYHFASSTIIHSPVTVVSQINRVLDTMLYESKAAFLGLSLAVAGQIITVPSTSIRSSGGQASTGAQYEGEDAENSAKAGKLSDHLDIRVALYMYADELCSCCHGVYVIDVAFVMFFKHCVTDGAKKTPMAQRFPFSSPVSSRDGTLPFIFIMFSTHFFTSGRSLLLSNVFVLFITLFACR